MPAGDEYAAASGAGKLKLKSSKVSDGSRVEKKKKKKKQQQQQHQQLEGEGIEDTTTAVTTVGHPDGANDEEVSTTTLSGAGAEAGIKAVSSRDNEEEDVAGDATGAGVGKTEAERKYEEVRRKRVRSPTINQSCTLPYRLPSCDPLPYEEEKQIPPTHTYIQI